MAGHADSLCKNIKDWEEVSNPGNLAPEYLTYKLSHRYPDDEVPFIALMGNALRARYLKDPCENAGLCLYLARVERYVMGTITGDKPDIYAEPQGARYVDFSRGGYYAYDDWHEDDSEVGSVDSAVLRNLDMIADDSMQFLAVYHDSRLRIAGDMPFQKHSLIQRALMDREMEMEHPDTGQSVHRHQCAVRIC